MPRHYWMPDIPPFPGATVPQGGPVAGQGGPVAGPDGWQFDLPPFPGTLPPLPPEPGFDWSGLLSGALGAGANFAAGAEGIRQAREIGESAFTRSRDIGEEAVAGTAFRPFAVSTGTGGITTSPEGGFSSVLNPDLRSDVDFLRGTGRGLLETATTGLDPRVNAISRSLAQARAPQRERDRLDLEERLFGQGRTGVRTSQFGGTPEQLALAKAQAEQESADLFTARNQAITEQQQLAELGSGLFSQSFEPEQNLLGALTQGIPIADIAGTGQRQGEQFRTALAQSGLEGLLQGQTIAGNLQQQQLQGVIESIFGGQADPNRELINAILASQGIDFQLPAGSGGLFDTISGLFT
jgi:hypothetical protein